jgi:hypothetical protein
VTDPIVTVSIAFVIDPARRRQGLATSRIQALTHHPELTAVELFEGGIEPVNDSSRAPLAGAGFSLRSPLPDCKGCSTTALGRPAHQHRQLCLDEPWRQATVDAGDAVPDIDTLAALDRRTSASSVSIR